MFFIPGQRANIGWLCVCDPTRSEPMAPVIFLDVDGVLNHPGVYAECAKRPGQTRPVEWLDRTCIARVSALCERTGAVVVISSGWRRYLGAEGAAAVLREGGLTAPVLGATPEAPFAEIPGAVEPMRWGEIRQWLASRLDVTRWVVIDDLALEGVPAERFVRTDGAVGITEADCERAAAALGAP